jgi:hypothetical protein
VVAEAGNHTPGRSWTHVQRGGRGLRWFSVKGGADLGILGEYLYDGRDTEAPVVSLEDDIFVGLRLALNDVNDTMLLVGSIFDRDDGGSVSLLEAQRRIGDRSLVEAELRWLREAKKLPLLFLIESSVEEYL